ncbi:MAG: glycoside hydrolase family 16 protein [Treponema sp.]|jgi:beta-glucanase (GH16 family)|nr:glycoside hydrolase family 16 protein [Treponema sp.]
MKSKFIFFGIIVVAIMAGFAMTACANNGGSGSGGNGLSGENLIFSDEFDGDSLDRAKWDYAPNWDRQGGSSWRDDMVSVGGGVLHLKFKRDPSLGKGDDWIRAGAVRTRKKNPPYDMIFANSYGYYEARIKFPVVSGTWGAFWLMCKDNSPSANAGEDGTEIDIVESINSAAGRYNAALHWNGYGTEHQSVSSADNGGSRPVNIYDGEFHVFALEWTETEYVFYVDNIAFWRVDGGPSFKNCGINRTQNYIKLTVEAALAGWAGKLPSGFIEDEMLVDYVRVCKKR